jgi:TolB protein
MKNHFFYTIIACWLMLTPVKAQIGDFTAFTHVGNADKKGDVSYDSAAQQYSLEGASGNMWFANDDFHFLWKKLKGNFILQTRIQFTGKGVEAHRKMGLMIRHSLEPNSPHTNAVIHGDGLTSLQFRKTPGGDTGEKQFTEVAPDVLQLERRGNLYIMSAAKSGEPFKIIELADVELGDDVYAGIFICSHNADVVEKGVFSNVRLIVPIKENFTPYRDYIGSYLEIMDVESGLRKIVLRDPGTMQCPNWTRDSQSLIYDKKGLLYNFNLQSKTVSLIPTDFADRNNNDHVLSFDGKMLGISHNSKDDDGNSVVYTVPASGGKPTRVTALSPSYLHGWSPDGKFLTYTAQRNGDFDIYKIPVKGGKETRLTNTKGLDDGSEYSPDGRFIYYNSVRSGTMQIWRMKPDGSKHEQITNDQFNNWFPHLSPDGKTIVFISFPKEVSPDDHPYYKHVYLRVMPVAASQPKIIAYVYGGQGTINVPSWSPDGRQIAFISNSVVK